MEIVHIAIDYDTICKKVLHDQLNGIGLDFTLNQLTEIQFQSPLSDHQKSEMGKALKTYGITLLKDRRQVMVQRIKDAIVELIYDSEKHRKHNVSTFLTQRLNYSYAYLSSQFSEVTHTSIENFIILKKIDAAKQLIIEKNLTLTEIAYRLNYSSVAHLSAQFKKTTGLTPSAFQRIIKKRGEKDIVPKQ
ncbi:Transcriptional regulator, AraC family [Croceitalea dokdonensis DOKDO 023]|uniref:Transcriptional regulator, AraC family n=1 Tax=Croceitalea dokdonensis DOKDO 023 TaxID=1300341 RepID=A0A0P7A615_9FLAO|nr:AraC family transcriptional regulator [Croceitalea dokdonensis]KPM32119.1 Transcriptional regulator, AraC family [Croceitalea dokdonensis DOKDO 023]